MNAQKMRNRSVSLSLVSLLLALFLVVPNVSSNADEVKPAEFSACVDRTKSGSVLILMDESNSIYDSDPDGNRIVGAQVLVDEIQEMATVRRSQISVRLAGFGADYVIRSGSPSSWDQLGPGKEAVAESLKENTEAVWGGANPVSNANRSETDVWTAADGALKDLTSQSTQCKLLVFFKDGADWQYFQKGFEQTPSLPSEIQDLLATGVDKDRNDAATKAAEDICRPTGLADAYRSTGIYVLGVAVPTKGEGEDFSDFEGFVEGIDNCGTLPAKGQVITADNVTDLPWKFSEALDPNSPSKQFVGEFAFQLSDALVGVNILASGSQEYSLVPPQSCEVKEVDLAGPAGSIGSHVAWTRRDYSANERAQAFKLNLKYDPAGTPECWKGEWKVRTDTGTRSQIDLDADLQAVAVFSAKEPLIFPGGESQTFTIKIQRISSGEFVTQAELHPDLRLELEGQLFAPDGTRNKDLFTQVGGRLTEANILTVADQLEFSESAPQGNYSLLLTLAASVNGLPGIELKPQTTETRVIVGSAPTLPTAANQIDFGTITGFEPVTKTVEFVGGTEDACIDLSGSAVQLSAAPKDANYVVSGGCIPVAAGQSVAVDITFAAESNNPASANGPVSGKIIFAAILDKSPDQRFALAPVDFIAYQEAQPNQLIQIIASIVFLILGMLLAFFFLILISKLVARFPSQKEVNDMQLSTATIPIRVSKSMGAVTVTGADGSPLGSSVANAPDWEFVLINNRRTAVLADETIRAKSGGLNFTSPGYAEPSSPVAGIGGPVVGLSESDSSKPRIPLALQKSWMAVFPPSELAAFQQASDGILYGNLIVIASNDAGYEGRTALAEEAAVGIATNVERRVSRSKKAPKERKVTEAISVTNGGNTNQGGDDVFRF